MYYLAIQQFARTLKNLDAILVKAQDYATARKFDSKNYLAERLHPEMLPFAFQVRNCCDQAKNAAALLAGKEPPRFEDKEATLEELRGRVASCLAYLATFNPTDYAKVDDNAIIKLPYPQGKGMRAVDYLLERQIPNFYFHVSTAYALLRRAGVEIGKSDYLGHYDTIDL